MRLRPPGNDGTEGLDSERAAGVVASPRGATMHGFRTMDRYSAR
jgi:hypothetical protein